jgi:hypothetical protein
MTQQRLHERDRIWYFVFYGRISQNADFLEGGPSERRGFSMYNYLFFFGLSRLLGISIHPSFSSFWGCAISHSEYTASFPFHTSLSIPLYTDRRGSCDGFVFIILFPPKLRIWRALDFWRSDLLVCFRARGFSLLESGVALGSCWFSIFSLVWFEG